ncbi:MAG TPA: hypothetical protein VLA43_12110, partial [Longimicrobiales bacterium]|nr:hypothetical protein [Longimicrobiales bacterium]
MSPVRAGLAAMVAVVLTVLTAAGSRVPVTFSGEEEALLRLSWRMPGIATEACRTLTAEELARLPVHMRNPQACIGVIASYAMEVRVDGTVLARDTVSPRGARGDRPLNVLREFPLPAGEHDVAVSFLAILPEGVEVPAEGVRELSWEGQLHLQGRDVALVTLDPSASRLEVRTPGR